MKISISLPEADVLVLDSYVQASGLPSRSAAVHRAVALLSQSGLEDDYAAAWDEWEASADRDAWESTAADGLADASR
jgi:Arc/MetJ-type ribon-helix-helix transcriptional regulator